MAHDTYNLMISLVLDGVLEEEEEQKLRQHIQACNICADTWDRMSLLDTMFSAQTGLMSPSADFTTNVMARVKKYEARRRWYPWLVTLLVLTSLFAALNIVMPMLFFSLELYKPLLELPVFGTLTQGLSWLQVSVSTATTTMNDWFTFLVTDPVTLATVLAALVLASTWIGLREGFKSMAVVISQQRA